MVQQEDTFLFGIHFILRMGLTLIGISFSCMAFYIFYCCPTQQVVVFWRQVPILLTLLIHSHFPPFQCSGGDAWVDVGNKRVGVLVLQSYLGIPPEETLHIGDQFLNTGNDFAARSVCPCVWITSPEETTYILKSILRLAGVPLMALILEDGDESRHQSKNCGKQEKDGKKVDFEEVERRSSRVMMDVYTGEMISKKMGA